MNKEQKERISRTLHVIRIAEDKGNPKCKHKFKEIVHGNWLYYSAIIFCEKCGAWKEVV